MKNPILTMSSRINSRINRLLTEKVLILSAKYSNSIWEFTIKSQSGGIYVQTFDNMTCKCSCPDTNDVCCKHILHIIAKIGSQLEIADMVHHDRSKWDQDMYQTCSKSWITKMKKYNKSGDINENCPICFDNISTGASKQCSSCHKQFHEDCLASWLAVSEGNTCPLCRGVCDAEGEFSSVSPKVLFDVDLDLNITNPIADILFTFDTTGSMYPCINEVKRNLAGCIKKLFTEMPDLRIAVIAHGDYYDKDSTYLTKHIDFTNNEAAIVSFVESVGRTCGGDFPEAYEYVLRESRSLSWRPNANAKSLVMIGDAVPQDPAENPEHIDWKQEVERLAMRNIQIFSIQCLDRGSINCHQFYEHMAKATNGYHLQLDQFSYVTDMIEAICYRQYNVSRLEEFEEMIQNREGGLTLPMKKMFDVMLGRKIEVSCRSSTSKTKIATSTVTVDDSPLVACNPSKFQSFMVDEDMPIKTFCMKMGITFRKGRGFYEFTKPECIKSNKEIVLMKKDTQDLFEGGEAWKLAGIPRDNSSKKVKPTDIEQYRVFIQSTSVNRKLIGGQRFLYEVNYE